MSTHTNLGNAAAAPVRAIAPSPRLRMLGAAVAATLAVDAYVHLHDAAFYQSPTAAISKGTVFQVQAVIAIVTAIALLVRPHPPAWALAVLVSVSAVAAVVLYSYVDVGAIGPLQDMYEPSWQVPGKLVSACFEGAGGLLSITGLVLAIRARGGVPATRRTRSGPRA